MRLEATPTQHAVQRLPSLVMERVVTTSPRQELKGHCFERYSLGGAFEIAAQWRGRCDDRG